MFFVKLHLQDLCLLTAHWRAQGQASLGGLSSNMNILVSGSFTLTVMQAGSGMLGGSEMMHRHVGHGRHKISSIGGHGGLGTTLTSQSVMIAGSHVSVIYLIIVMEMYSSVVGIYLFFPLIISSEYKGYI